MIVVVIVVIFAGNGLLDHPGGELSRCRHLGGLGGVVILIVVIISIVVVVIMIIIMVVIMIIIVVVFVIVLKVADKMTRERWQIVIVGSSEKTSGLVLPLLIGRSRAENGRRQDEQSDANHCC